MDKKKLKGFTLVELITVIAIIGVLAGLATMAMVRWINETRARDANANAKLVFNAVQTVVTPHATKKDDPIPSLAGMYYSQNFYAYYNGSVLTYFVFTSATIESDQTVTLDNPQQITDTVFLNKFMKEVTLLHENARRTSWCVFVNDYNSYGTLSAPLSTSRIFGSYPYVISLTEVNDISSTLGGIAGTLQTGLDRIADLREKWNVAHP